MVLVAALAAAPAAEAHGIGGSDPNRPVAEYLWLGFKHLVVGWDHLLFILGIVLLAGGLWLATKLISLFVLGHSVTLMLATTQEWTVSTTFVDIVIALSLVLVAGIALHRGQLRDWRGLGAALLAIGLVHGLGLGTRLLELGVSDDALTWRIIAFNVGVELGQAAAVLAFGAVLAALARYAPTVRRTAMQPAFMGIAAAGIIGTAVVAVDAGSGKGGGEGSAADAAGEVVSPSCTVADSPVPPANDAGHPGRKFYLPREPLPRENFDHVVGDGYVVVTYRPDIPEGDVATLKQIVEGENTAMIAGPDRRQEPALLAVTARRTLTCDEFDRDALLAFRDAWFREVFGA